MIRDRDALGGTRARETALDCIEAGIAAADAERAIGESLGIVGRRLTVGAASYDLAEYEGIVVLGGGNAGGRMAAALEGVLGEYIDRGAVVTDAPAETERIDVLAGDHPVPSERGVESTRRILELAGNVGEDALVLVVVSGGGSALMPAPAEDVSLAALQSVTEALLESGATIDEINAVRKHCSALKGGGLARTAAPATVIGLVISDVIGNDLGTIASGPTAPDETTFGNARAVLNRYGIDPPEEIRDRLNRGERGDIDETPGPDDPVFDRVENHVLADGFTPLAAVRDVACERDYEPLILSSSVRGEACEAAKTHAAIGEEIRATGNPIEPPAVVCSGGETTVTLRGDGTGGPNQEFALSAAIELRETEGVALGSVDTDGIDGATDAAGAIVDGDTVEDAEAARDALAANDAFPYLEERGAIVDTGPTGTNVNDLRVLVIEA